MDKDEDQEYRDQLKKDEIDVEEQKEPTDELEEEDKESEEVVEEKEEEKEEILEEEDPKEKKVVKRSIYQEYKDKKSELKDEKELRIKAEEEVDELKVKLEAYNNADTPEDKKEVLDEIGEFAKEINADPEALKKMQALFLKGMKKPATDEALKKDLEDFKTYREQNQEVIEKQSFDTEYKDVLPGLKKDFPSASDKELDTIKEKVDELSHTEDFHDKTLDYVVFKNKETLSALVSPKKKGMESKEKNDIIGDDDFVFDPNADLSKLSPKDQDKWQEAYHKLSSSDELVTSGNGGKIIL